MLIGIVLLSLNQIERGGLSNEQSMSKEATRTIPFDSKPGKFRPDDNLPVFLNQL